ncbi:MAG: glycoside hydrolase family 2 TIM barrel-domain containing protein [Fimbriimonas sp.]
MIVSGLVTSLAAAQAPTPMPRPRMVTPWTAKVSPTKPHPEYPRPQMVRKDWTNLNGKWDVAVTTGTAKPDYRRKILVPFPIESFLSGIGDRVPDGGTVWYRRTFNRPKGDRVILHFGAVDWRAKVWVNGKEVGTHEGGFDPFHFDVTDALKPSGPQEIIVSVEDPTDAGPQPRGKQVRKPGGIFYVPTTGIWQTVWLEGVPERSIDRLKVTARNDGTVNVAITARGGSADGAWVEIREGGRVLARMEGPSNATIRIPNPKLWEPGSPKLYDLRVGLGKDVVDSYFGFREVSVGRAPDGKTRLLLNGKPLFMVGPLDQGFWPDGLFTPPTDAAMKYDVDVTKRLGFNTIRKHVKVEPATWYAHCDRQGILVWQDMPSGDRSIGSEDPDITRTPESAAIFEKELKAMVDGLHNHPSIVTWVLFNEGWGQYDTDRMSKWLKDYDPTRLLDAVSGWADRKVGDMWDWHVYPGPASPKPEPTRAAVLGEFGGLGLPVQGHMWEEKNWGYQTFRTKEELTRAFESLFLNLRFLQPEPGLSAAIYTQTTDVETETNGLMTYDRQVMKMDERRVRNAIMALFGPPVKTQTVLESADEKAALWRYTTTSPREGWQNPDFSDSGWQSGEAGFGTDGTPGGTIRTRWATPDIWIRRTFTLPSAIDGDLFLRVHHDEDAEIYLDGKLVQTLRGYTSAYRLVALPKDMKLAAGTHTLAVHCRQTNGGQYIDLGLMRIVEK